MTKFCTLVSGSSGNAAYLSHNGTNILIDCGISGKAITASLESIGASCDEIDAILVTHEHNDHTGGVGVLSRRYDIPVIASNGTWNGMNIGAIKEKNRICFHENHQIDVGEIGIIPFNIPHDANQPTGFRFDLGNRCVAVATDIGHINEEIKQAVCGCEMVILEANYDLNMLENGPYPYHLKQRIKGKKGHLCNDDTADIAKFLIQNGTNRILLGHLSNENNIPNLAFKTVAQALKESGICGKDVAMAVAPRYIASPVMGA